MAQIAQQFKASIRVAREGTCEEVDAKSILAILTLGAQKGQSLFLRADGDDAEEAVAAMVRLIEENFGEDQGNRSEE